MISPEIVNIIAFLVFFFCVVSFGIKLHSGMKKPSTSKRGLLNLYYQTWVNRMAEEDNKIEAIQTMRNLIMSVTFLSSTLLIMLGILVQNTSDRFDNIFNFPTLITTSIPEYKLLVLFVVIVFSLIMFLLSLRHMVRFSILIGIPTIEIEKTSQNEISEKKESRDFVDARMIQKDVFLKAMNRFTYGIRGVYYVVVLLLWFISAYAFIIGAIIITILLIRYHDVKTPCLDKTPI